MRNWEITLEYNEGKGGRPAHWFWQVAKGNSDPAWVPLLGAGRVESLMVAMDEISSVVDVDLNNDWVE